MFVSMNLFVWLIMHFFCAVLCSGSDFSATKNALAGQVLINSKNESVIVTDLGWTSDKNLQATRKLSIANYTNKSIIGIFLKFEVTSGNQSAVIQDYGKIKINISAHSTKICKILAERIGRDSEVVLNSNVPSWAGLIVKNKLKVNTVVFEDGSFDSGVVINR